MNPGVTWLVVGAVAAVSLAAAVDAWRGEGEAAPPSVTTSATTTEREPAEPAAGRGLEGVLYYTDTQCRLRGLELSSQREVEVPPWDECGFSLSPRADRAAPPRTLWASDGEPVALPAGARAPALTRDGRLTYFREGVIVDAASGRTVVSEGVLRAALRFDSNVPENERFVRNFRVEEMAWLDETRFVAIMAVDVLHGPHEELIAIYDGLRYVNVKGGFGTRFSDLNISPAGSWFAARTSSRPGFLLLDSLGGSVPAPPVTSFRAIAWSPDERWAALASDAGIDLFRTGTPDLELRRLDLAAGDLAWRDPDAQPPPLPDTDRARTLLVRGGSGGTLYVADLNCRLHALRLPEVEWLNEPAAVGPCRFTVNANGEPFPDGATFERAGELGALCRRNTVYVFHDPGGIGLRQVDGCAPAWKPDGSLTVLRDGRLVQVTGLDQQRVLLSRDDIARALGAGARLREVAWIDNDSFGTVVRRRGRLELAVFRGKGLVRPPSFSSPRIRSLRAGGSGLLAAETGTPQAAVSFFDRESRLLLSVGGREFSWQPGGTVAAVAGRLQVLLVAPLTRDAVSLSLLASDLEWR